MARSELERIADQFEAKRLATTKVMFGLGRIGQEESRRRMERWWRCRALDWVDRVRALAPPSDWSFMTKLSKYLEGAHKQEKEALSYSDAESRAWRSFMAWHSEVSSNMELLVELLKEHAERPCEPLLQQRLVDRGCEVKERYQRWIEERRILWMPVHWGRNQGSVRTPCNVVEYAADALNHFENQPPYAYTPEAFKVKAAELRREFHAVTAKFFGVKP